MRSFLCIASFALALASLPDDAPAQRRDQRGPRTGISMHYENTQLRRIVDAVGRDANQRFIYSDNLSGSVTITVPGRVTRAEALELLMAALYLKGFTAIPMEDGGLKIVPIVQVKSSAPTAEALDSTADRPMTTLVEMKHIDAGQALEALKPYVSDHAVALAHTPTNSLILAGTESQLVRMITIARVVDQARNERIVVRTLRYRRAEAASQMVEAIFNATPVVSDHLKIVIDERTNQLVLQGPAVVMQEARVFLDNFDRPVEGEGLVRVVHVINRDAEEMASLLQSLATGSSAPGARSPRVGGAAPISAPGSAATARSAGASAELAGRPYHIEVDVPTQSLLIGADPETFEILARVISELDRLPPRVSVEVLVFEVTRPRGYRLGLNYFQAFTSDQNADFAVFAQSANANRATIPGTNFPAVGGPTGPTGDSVLFGRYTRDPITLTLDNDGVPITLEIPTTDVSIEAGETLAETNILIRPNIIGVSGEEHEVFAGNNIPIPTAQTATTDASGNVNNNPLNVTQNIERVDVGTRLRIRPTLGEEGTIRLELDLEVSELTASRAGPVEEVGPTYADREIEATLELKPGYRAVIGATGSTVSGWQKTGIPILMDIPFLGWLFSTVEERTDQTDLVAVVEARVVRDADEAAAETIRRRLAFERSISRSADLQSVGREPFAVLLETTRSERDARVIADAFGSDGFETRIIPWDAWGQQVWDVYLTELASFEEAGRLARRLTDAGWSPEIAVLSPVNELAGD